MKENIRIVRSSCRGCHGVCQVLIHMKGDRVVKVTGDPESPTSRGYLCPKGAAATELLYHPDRLTHPLRRKGERGENRWERITWDEALDDIADRFSRIKNEDGSEYVAMAQGTGRPYMNFSPRFASAFGTSNYVGVGHLCYLPCWFSSCATLGQLPIADVYGLGGVDPACIIIWGCNITEMGASDGMCGGMALWVPPAGIKQQSIFMNPEAMGRQFLPQEKADKTVTAGKFSFEFLVQPPSFWRSVVTGDPYRVKAMWILGSNPLLTHTNSLDAERALKDFLEFTVVSDMFMTPTAQLADMVLPAASWLETDDVVNLHKIWCVLARKKVAQIGETRDDKEVMIQLAKRLGLTEAFPWDNFREYLDWVLRDSGMTFEEFCDCGIVMGQMQYEKYKHQGFDTESGKFEFYNENLSDFGLAPLPTFREPVLSPVSSPELAKLYPLILTAGRAVRNFFHSEGRQIKTLRKGNPDPLVQIHPDTASDLGISDGDWVWIETPGNRRIMQKAELFDGIVPINVNAQ